MKATTIRIDDEMILPDSLDQIQAFETANSFLIKQMVSVLLVFSPFVRIR